MKLVRISAAAVIAAGCLALSAVTPATADTGPLYPNNVPMTNNVVMPQSPPIVVVVK